MLHFREIQEGVTKMEEFRNNTVFVETHQYFVEQSDLKGDVYDGARHYYGRADTVLNIGRAFGHGMVGLLGDDQ